ncbi:MAG: amidohydrolase family protein [Hyphomicrobiales bacterium]
MTFRKLSGTPPKIALPKGAVDTHIHIYDSKRFGPEEGGPGLVSDALIEHYEQVQKWLGLERVVLTNGNGYQFNNRCTLDALYHFGEKARAIVAINPETITDDEIDSMTMQGVRGARIMNILQGAIGLEGLLAVNARVKPFGWNLIVQFDGREMVQHEPLLKQIQGDYVIDHTGKYIEPVSVDDPSFTALLRLIDRGNCYVKLAGYYETSIVGAPGYDDVAAMAKALIAYAPERILWATNWPHNMAVNADIYPNDAHLIDLMNDWAGSTKVRQQIFVDNPSQLYGF